MASLCGPLRRASPWLVAGLLVLGAGCKERLRSAPVEANASAVPRPAKSAAAVDAAKRACPEPEIARPTRPLRRCFAELPAWVDSPVALLLDKAGEYLAAADFESTLACAEEAARQAPRSVEAHHDRSIALIRLSRHEEARDALALALAIAPRDAETLEIAADFYINHLAPSAERATIGLEYARRGRSVASSGERERAARLALLEGQALIDLGRSSDALVPIDRAIRLAPGEAAPRYERGVALFELCRFDDSRRAFDDVVAIDSGHAHALYHLGLIHERLGRDEEASRSFAEASARDPKSFPTIPQVSAAEFADRVRRALAALSADVQNDLAAITVDTAELPAIEDLTAELPPLSPTILGLFRGLPLGRDDVADPTTAAARGARGRQARVPAGASASGNPASFVAPERAIVLYRRNILRSVQSVAELDRAIERTLLHEVGHLRGEDDGSLRDRGLE